MKVSLKWLKTMVDVPVDLAEFTEQMQLTGTEVDAVDVVGARLDGVVVGQIIDKQPLPESDHLWVTTVDVGSFNLNASDSPSPLQIVCGAQNFNNGDKVAVALVGTTLPNGAQIKKTKLRGVESSGMNCSALELGLGEDHEGIMILPESAPVGTSLAEYLDLSDVVLDLDITPNRADCMSMLGVAREVAAVYGLEYQLPAVETLIESLPASSGSVSKLVSAQINDPIRCPRYTARLIRGVKVGPSPDWLVERVTAAGTRSVNNVVDITNYIMYELGQPLHVFDYDSLAQDASGQVKIVVRAAHDGEKFTTLDGVERLLEPDITCIVDANAAAGAGATIALAGVMGGLTSEVSDATVNVLLESAAFSANHTSRTSRRLQLVSESSMRYERGVDDRSSADYSLRAAILIAAVAGGVIEEGVVDCYPLPRELPELEFRIERFARFVGANIPVQDIKDILTRLGCTVALNERAVPSSEQLPSGLESILRVIPPSYRPDLLREIDLYEEVLRVWGMNRVQPTLPGGRERTGQLSETQAKERQLGRLLRSMGLNETMTYAFVPPTDATDVPMGYSDNEQLVELINPLSSEMSVLRRSILPGLLRSVAYNLHHGTNDIKLYEMGTVFHTHEGRKQPKERQMLAAVLVGAAGTASWNREYQAVDFFDAKGILETIGRELNIAKLRFKALTSGEAAWLQSGRAASVLAGSSVLGWIGEVHPRVARAFDIDVPVIAFELEYSLLIKASQLMRPFVDIPLFPAVQRDLAVVVDESVTSEQVSQVIKSSGGVLLSEIRLFDVFTDAEKLGAGKKSLAFSLSYRAADRTLVSEEVEYIHQKVLNKVTSVVGGEIRV